MATSSPRRLLTAPDNTAWVPSIASALPRPMHIFFGRGHRIASGATMAPGAYGLLVGIVGASAEDNPRFSLRLLPEPFHSVPSRQSPKFWIRRLPSTARVQCHTASSIPLPLCMPWCIFQSPLHALRFLRLPPQMFEQLLERMVHRL